MHNGDALKRHARMAYMDGELPDDRSKLYDRYIDGMLGLWELNKELATPTVPLTKEQKKKVLAVCRICFDIYSAILTYFTMIHHEELSLL